MKYIPLTQGQFTIVDDIDYDWLNQHKWCAQKNHSGGFYAVRQSPMKNNKSHQIRIHRLILGLEHGDHLQGDHINHNTLDNTRNNLRICTSLQNQMNRKSQQNTTSKYKGVFWHNLGKKWQASIKVKGKSKYLGLYNTEKDAAEAYNEAAKKYFENFAYLNVLA